MESTPCRNRALRRRESSDPSKSHLGKLGFEGHLELLQIRGWRPIALLLRAKGEAPGLIEIPRRRVPVAKGDFAAYHSAGAGNLVNGNAYSTWPTERFLRFECRRFRFRRRATGCGLRFGRRSE